MRPQKKVLNPFFQHHTITPEGVICLGMGIDKASVRVVVHWEIPMGGVSGYSQESGRAGRDGNLSHARIYYSRREDSAIVVRLTKSYKESENQLCGQYCIERLQEFKEMERYCLMRNGCRRVQLGQFFGDGDIAACGDRCDLCLNVVNVNNKLDNYLNFVQNNNVVQNLDLVRRLYDSKI